MSAFKRYASAELSHRRAFRSQITHPSNRTDYSSALSRRNTRHSAEAKPIFGLRTRTLFSSSMRMLALIFRRESTYSNLTSIRIVGIFGQEKPQVGKSSRGIPKDH